MFLINKIVFALNVVAALLLLGSYLSPSVSPQTVWPIAFLGLAYVILLVVNIVFVLYWLLQAKLYLFISLGAIIFGFSYTGRFFQLQGSKKSATDTTLKMMTFNIQNFDERHNGGNPYPEFFEYVKNEKPDILCLQEFNPWVGITKTTSSYQELTKAMGNKPNYVTRDNKSNDLAIITRLPILKSKGIVFGKHRNSNGAMWADIVFGRDTIRVFNVHLQSFLISKVKIEELENKDKAFENSKNIIRRLRSGFANRVPQVDSILAEIELSPYKVILCGDFNDTPMSYTYGQITDKMKDAFVECGSGLGATYTGPYPSFRIDYIMLGASLQSYNYKRGGSYGSDHRVVQAEIKIK
jgi:endonuclease/exonuclease/phosphatase family metal-dependent hydrolase